jgi:hypothetical protein
MKMQKERKIQLFFFLRKVVGPNKSTAGRQLAAKPGFDCASSFSLYHTQVQATFF